jgi:tetratricopeptide (TPR) repeat protein
MATANVRADTPVTDYQRGAQLMKSGQIDAAITAFRSALDGPAANPVSERQTRRRLAEALRCRAVTRVHHSGVPGRPCDDATLGSIREAMEVSPNFADLHFYMGLSRISRDEYGNAVPSLKRALLINPRYTRAAHALAIAMVGAGNWQGGLAQAQAALELDPALKPGALIDAKAAYVRGNLRDALEALWRMSDARIDDEIPNRARTAMDLYRKGLVLEAEQECRLAVAQYPWYADLHNQLGVIRCAIGRDEDAITAYRRAIGVNPNYTDAYVNLGLSLARLGRRDEARQAYQSALEIDPYHSGAIAALLMLERNQSRS